MNVGDYIKKLRSDAGLSQEQLGKMIGVQKSAVHKWESGLVTNLKRETIKKLSEIFSVPAASFIDDTEVITINIGKIIKDKRLSMGLTLEEVGNAVGVGKSTVKKWEDGYIANMRRDKIAKISSVLNLDPVRLIDNGQDLNLRLLNEPLTAGAKIPVLGKVPAGIPIEAVEDIIDEIELSTKMVADGKEYFALLVSGNSMFPEYMDGDIVIVRKQETAETGDDVVAYVNGDDATLKRLLKSVRGITLRPLNPEFEARTYSNEEIQSIPVRIAGVVVEQRRNRK